MSLSNDRSLLAALSSLLLTGCEGRASVTATLSTSHGVSDRLCEEDLEIEGNIALEVGAGTAPQLDMALLLVDVTHREVQVVALGQLSESGTHSLSATVPWETLRMSALDQTELRIVVDAGTLTGLEEGAVMGWLDYARRFELTSVVARASVATTVGCPTG